MMRSPLVSVGKMDEARKVLRNERAATPTIGSYENPLSTGQTPTQRGNEKTVGFGVALDFKPVAVTT